MGAPEGKIENYLIRECEKRGWLCLKFVSPSRRGVPDRIIIGNKQTVFVELKSESGRPSHLQIFMINKIRKAGGIAYIVNSKDEVDRLLSCIEKEKHYKQKPLKTPSQTSKKKPKTSP